jgi:hypothetical protein
VQDREEADLGTEMLRIGGDRPQGIGGGGEEQVVDDGLVLMRDGSDFLRKSEDDVKVGNRKQFSLAIFYPLRTCERLTLRAVAIATAVIADALMTAVVTALDVTAEGSGAACSNSLHDAPLRTRERALVLRTIGVTVPADDLRQLDLRSLHRERGSEVFRRLGRFRRR